MNAAAEVPLWVTIARSSRVELYMQGQVYEACIMFTDICAFCHVGKNVLHILPAVNLLWFCIHVQVRPINASNPKGKTTQQVQL